MTAPTFKRAERAQVKLKALHMGPSGSGKTKGALAIATTIAPGKVALIDSENDRSSYYADAFVFDSLALESCEPKRYEQAIDAALAAGYEFIVIDGLSHAWQDVLDRKEAYDRANPRSNGYANWKIFGGEWDRLVRHILEAPIHIIATARSKQAYELVEDQNGKKRPEKMGLQPTIREGTEYEFALVFDILPSHRARATKDNLGLFEGEAVLWDLCDPKIAALLKEWLGSGKPYQPSPPRPSAPTMAGYPISNTPASNGTPAITRESALDFGKSKGSRVCDLDRESLRWLTEPGRKIPNATEWAAAAQQELDYREQLAADRAAEQGQSHPVDEPPAPRRAAPDSPGGVTQRITELLQDGSLSQKKKDMYRNRLAEAPSMDALRVVLSDLEGDLHAPALL